MKNIFYKIYQKSSKRYRQSANSGRNMWEKYPTQILRSKGIDVFDEDHEIHMFELIHISTQPLK